MYAGASTSMHTCAIYYYILYYLYYTNLDLIVLKADTYRINTPAW